MVMIMIIILYPIWIWPILLGFRLNDATINFQGLGFRTQDKKFKTTTTMVLSRLL